LDGRDHTDLPGLSRTMLTRERRCCEWQGARRRGDPMRRRDFISLVGAMTAAWPLVTRAHQAGMEGSGLLMNTVRTDPEETFSDAYRKSITISRKTTGTCHLTPEEFQTAYPKLRAWIQKTLE